MEQGDFKFEIEPQVLPPLSLTNDFTSIVCMFVLEGSFRLQYLFNLPKNFLRHLSWKLLIYGLADLNYMQIIINW